MQEWFSFCVNSFSDSVTHLAPIECAAAKTYWEKNSAYWGKVRKIWADYINTHNIISLKNKIDGKLLHEYLISQAKDYADKKITEADIDRKIAAEITKFIGQDEKTVAVQ